MAGHDDPRSWPGEENSGLGADFWGLTACRDLNKEKTTRGRRKAWLERLVENEAAVPGRKGEGAEDARYCRGDGPGGRVQTLKGTSQRRLESRFIVRG